jgi:hypothetical protein
LNILATPTQPVGPTKRVTVLCGSKDNSFAQQLETYLATEGLAVKICILGEEPPVGQDIISVLDLERPFFDDVTASDFESFKRLILNIQSAGMLWVTRPSQIGCDDPRCAMALGMARTIRSELAIDFATLEVDEISSTTWATVLQVLRKFHGRNKEGDVDPDFEFVLSNGKVHIGRFHPMSVSKELSTASEGDTKRLEIETFGLLETLHWIQGKSRRLTGDEVEIETRAVGLNFRVSSTKTFMDYYLTFLGCSNCHGNRWLEFDRLWRRMFWYCSRRRTRCKRSGRGRPSCYIGQLDFLHPCCGV